MLEDALSYAAVGLAVFPCKRDKSPMTANGFHDATTDTIHIRATWTATPDALIGAAIPEGHVVIDVDPRNGGDDTLRELLAGRKMGTRRARTGSGGYHYWFKWDLDPERIRSTLGDGIDVKRAGKGYVILPPSVSEAGSYEWTNNLPIADAPAWMTELLTKNEVAKREPMLDPTVRAPWQPVTMYGDRAIQLELKELEQTKLGERNDALNRSAFSVFQLVYGGEVDEYYARERIQEAAFGLGLSEREVSRTLDSAWEAAADSPRTAPPEDKASTRLERAAEPTFWTDWLVDEPEPPFYLHPVLPQNAYVLVYGATEASKSMVWNALLAEASYHDIRSSVYSLENPPHVDRQRLRRLDPDPANFRLTNQPLDMGHWEQTEALIEREKDWGTDVLLLDTYSHAFGSRSEDGNARAIEFARIVRHVMFEVGCSVIVIDHTGYVNKEEPRDASAKRQQVDVAILMEKEGDWVRGRNAHFKMSNYKSARFANPFMNLRGAVADLEDNKLGLAWSNQDVFGRWSK